ncbi:hypothetical protein [Paenibacillus sp. GCM10027626]|uniref:hypothetical protein n=1 Tax=Paenibacillus sp. GCM10027626 TaxID=3273411 RepID=UPI00362AB0D7
MSDRNYGCRIKQGLIYKGYETVVLENEKFRLTVLPGKGTDIIELLHKPTDTDFVWFTRLGLRPKQSSYRDFQSQYEGGWQEILPNLGGRHIHNGIEMEAYGEAALSEWSYVVTEDRPEEIRVVFRNELRSLPVVVEKTFIMESGRAGFRLEERLRNVSPAVIHTDWGHHITFGEPFLMPGTVVHVEGCSDSFIMPERGAAGGFDVLDGTRGTYLVMRPDGIGAEINWNNGVWPYVWFWRDYGGDSSPPYFGCHYNIGLELFSSPPASRLDDNIASGTAIKLEPHSLLESSLSFKVRLR